VHNVEEYIHLIGEFFRPEPLNLGQPQ